MLDRYAIRSLCFALCLYSAVSATAEELLTPPADSPQYQLSNLRTERDQLGRSLLVFDFKRTQSGEGSVKVGGKSGQAHITISAFVPSSQESGTLRLGSLFSTRDDVATDIELYLVVPYRLSGDRTGHAMVSNAVRLGNPGPPSTARAWTEDETAMHKEFVRIMNDDSAHKPLKSYPVSVQPPEGADFVPNTAKLTKGIQLQACFQDKWHPLTTISENGDGSLNVRWDTFGKQYDCSMSRGELVIESSVVSKLESHSAERFAKTVPNWSSEAAKTTSPPSPSAKPRKRYAVSIDVPSESQFVPQDLVLKAGIPLQACYAGKWNPITALGQNPDGTLNVRWDEYGAAFDCSMVREELIIKKSLAQLLRTDPAAVEVKDPRLAEASVAKPRKAYPVSIPVPADSAFVPKSSELEPGTKLQACYASKWNPITFLSHNEDGTLNVRWDDYGSAFDCSMVRNELIIKKSLLKALMPAKSSQLPKSPDAEFRTFTDSTGKYRVKAKVVKLTQTQVTLLTDVGKEVTLPLSNLSQADQEFLRSSNQEKNPFE